MRGLEAAWGQERRGFGWVKPGRKRESGGVVALDAPGSEGEVVVEGEVAAGGVQ